MDEISRSGLKSRVKIIYKYYLKIVLLMGSIQLVFVKIIYKYYLKRFGRNQAETLTG